MTGDPKLALYDAVGKAMQAKRTEGATKRAKTATTALGQSIADHLNPKKGNDHDH